MAPAPRTRRRPGTDVCDPGVITAAEWDTAMGFAAADAVVFDADWARLPARERERVAAREDAYDSDGHYLAPDYTPDLAHGQRHRRRGDGRRGGGDDPDADAEYARVEALRADGFGVQESGWLALAAAGAEQVSTRELLAIAEAAPGSLGCPGPARARGRGGLDHPAALHRPVEPRSWPPAATPSWGPCAQPEDGYRAEQHLVEELQVAARVGPGVAHRDIEAARLLAGPLARSHPTWRPG